MQDASPFLFPCTIEYSLICAAILYVMWRNLNRPELDDGTGETVRRELHPLKRSPHHYSVDCAGAHKGLFVGILMLVVTIIALIIFFVLIHKDEYTNFAVTEVNICELILYGSTILATLIGMIQVRKLHYDSARSFSLDDILLVGAQTGSFLYSTFTIIGAHLTLRPNTILILITAMASLFETAFQTMFILDASRRSAATPEHIRKKPGREIVTFLLVSNLAMWLINTLEKSRAESHPLQLTFYGVWAWTIITHVSMPLGKFPFKDVVLLTFLISENSFLFFMFLPPSDLLSFSQYGVSLRYLEASVENETDLHVKLVSCQKITHSTHAPADEENETKVN